jgi:hypothetical protein
LESLSSSRLKDMAMVLSLLAERKALASAVGDAGDDAESVAGGCSGGGAAEAREIFPRAAHEKF